jgi:osmoprotectant transport system permease protein
LLLLFVAAAAAVGLALLKAQFDTGHRKAARFEGLAQFATDLMLLGALPIVLLALLADTLARILETRLARPA